MELLNKFSMKSLKWKFSHKLFDKETGKSNKGKLIKMVDLIVEEKCVLYSVIFWDYGAGGVASEKILAAKKFEFCAAEHVTCFSHKPFDKK
jgi:hypothetical protein